MWSSRTLSRVAALATREAKERVDLPRLHEEWNARAAEHRLGRRELRALAGPPQPARAIELGEAAEQLLGREGPTANSEEAVRYVAEHFGGKADWG